VNTNVDDPSPLEAMSRWEICFEVDNVFKNDFIRIAFTSESVSDDFRVNNFVSYRSEMAM
jgi:hypothetical protein